MSKKTALESSLQGPQYPDYKNDIILIIKDKYLVTSLSVFLSSRNPVVAGFGVPILRFGVL